ncbi:Ser-Thr-rich glycosyl-phosphatidyl-inositol-anchored membrane family-domain-containing protein [Jimgerdemannia flammicorona]|uniref:Ser-Thr-rich glycosyl-phosphatidyl-inositol-anchored membrane family-domain-containing protein n=1 Tax=Jimgerdemannia flammicorona TaxID=994334 RepID=A0A433QNZ8_9FUNG|nr:Ser-Thr-rich glycosyl-phosphatidyl-inositol-anchored membrane family-domain-containing protein [Jimgerdemannia flammicorona]
MKFVILALVAFVASVSAQTTIPLCYITAPLQGTVWTVGQPATIAWNTPSSATFTQIFLMYGPSTTLQPVQQLAMNVPTAPMTYTFVVPATLAPRNDYAIVIGTQPTVAYSPQFSIQASKYPSYSPFPSPSRSKPTNTPPPFGTSGTGPVASGNATTPTAAASGTTVVMPSTPASTDTPAASGTGSLASASANPVSSSPAGSSPSAAQTKTSAGASNSVQMGVVAAAGVVVLVAMML